jgi:hypothetical protein
MVLSLKKSAYLVKGKSLVQSMEYGDENSGVADDVRLD